MNKNTGTTIYISSGVPKTLDKEGFEALEYTELKGLSLSAKEPSKPKPKAVPYNVFAKDEINI